MSQERRRVDLSQNALISVARPLKIQKKISRGGNFGRLQGQTFDFHWDRQPTNMPLDDLRRSCFESITDNFRPRAAISREGVTESRVAIVVARDTPPP